MEKSVYARPDKPRVMPVKKRQRVEEVEPLPAREPVVVHASTECHVTPEDAGARMVDYLGPTGDFLTLEPQAGTGNLIQALYDAGHSRNELVAIERHYELCKHVHKRFTGEQSINPINQCFLEYATEAHGKIEYPRIIMNPPFRQVKKHMQAALSLLGRGGHDEAVLVALVPVTYFHEDMEELETLPSDTFALAKVHTKIIRFVY